jgi:hypothetical protein
MSHHRTLADLRERLHAIDLVYFGGELEAKGTTIHWLRWESRKNHIRFGLCWTDTNRIEICRLLALPWVPDFVLLNVIYHEALHVILGPEHTREFAVFERQFVHYAEARVWETSNYDLLAAAPKPVFRRAS